MSIPSADHTIYSFITLCLKEQGDIAGRKEITARHKGGWGEKKVGCHHRQRHISVTVLQLRSRASIWGRKTRKRGCCSFIQPPLVLITPTCAALHMSLHKKLQHVEIHFKMDRITMTSLEYFWIIVMKPPIWHWDPNHLFFLFLSYHKWLYLENISFCVPIKIHYASNFSTRGS